MRLGRRSLNAELRICTLSRPVPFLPGQSRRDSDTPGQSPVRAGAHSISTTS